MKDANGEPGVSGGSTMAPGDPRQVWPLTHFRSVCFLFKKKLDLRGTQINDHLEGCCPLLFLPQTPSSQSRTHEGPSELTRRPQPRYLA